MDMEIKIKLPEEKVNEILSSVYKNYPEAGSGMTIQCKDWKYEEFIFTFVDTEEDKEYIITKEIALKGLQRYYELVFEGKLKMDTDFENWDAYNYDAIVQCAIFNDVIYG